MPSTATYLTKTSIPCAPCPSPSALSDLATTADQAGLYLPRTGGSIVILLLIAAALIALGVAAVQAARKAL